MASTAWFASRRCRTSTDPLLPATPSLGSARPWDRRLHAYGRNCAGNGRNAASLWRCPMPDSPTVSPIVTDRRPGGFMRADGGRRPTSSPDAVTRWRAFLAKGDPWTRGKPDAAGAWQTPNGARPMPLPAPFRRARCHAPVPPRVALQRRICCRPWERSAQETARAICSAAEQWPVGRPPGMARCNAMTRSRPAAGTTGLAATSGIMAPALRFPDEP